MKDLKNSTGVLKVTHKELGSLMDAYYKNKLFLMIYGTFGIGKSQVIKEKAKNIALSKKKDFIEWNKISRKEKFEIINEPEGKFVFIDERLSTYDSSDAKGLPNFNSEEDTIDWKIPMWAKLVTTEGSDGFLFFDECNLALPIVISSIYQVVLDRVVGDSKINDNWFILGAGNNEDDRAHTFELPPPVKDRGGELELKIPTVASWSEWASKNGIDKRIIAYLNWRGLHLSDVNHERANKNTTPRGYERLSKIINGVDDINLLDLLAKTAIGSHIASEFVSFCKIKDKIDLEEYIKTPKKIKKFNNSDQRDILYFLMGGVADRYCLGKLPYSKIEEFLQAFEDNDLTEFGVVMLKICMNGYKGFTKDYMNGTTITKKFAKKLNGVN